MLSAQVKHDLREAARLGLITEAVLEQCLPPVAKPEIQPPAPPASEGSKRNKAPSLADLQLGEAIALRELELAIADRDEEKIRRAKLHLQHFQRELESEMSNRLQKNHASLRSAQEPQASAPVQQEDSEPELPEPAVAALVLVKELTRFSALLCSSRRCELTPGATLGEEDAHLCLEWANETASSWTPLSGAIARILEIKPYEAARLLSARNAEKAALLYYQNLGSAVEDVSVTQLQPDSYSWKDFDITVDDRCVDIKNARESRNGNGQYVEHTVARFKHARGRGRDVSIAAAVSPYIKAPADFFESPQSTTMLGELNVAQLNDLVAWATARFGGRLVIRDPTRSNFLPGWMFEFTPAHYRGRELAIAAAPELLKSLVDSLAYTCEIPGWLWVFSDEALPVSLEGADVVRDLRSLHMSIGISRRSLYVLALGLALEELEADGAEENALQNLKQICRVSLAPDSVSHQRKPLGLDDPLDYVLNLIAVLADIVSVLRRRGRRVVGFHLVSPAILQGVEPSGRRFTLLAYCGGWQERPFLAPCGNSPLTFANHATCPMCGHLICDKCGHCSDSCEECRPRQAAVAASFDEFSPRASETHVPEIRTDWDPDEAPF